MENVFRYVKTAESSLIDHGYCILVVLVQLTLTSENNEAVITPISGYSHLQ